MADQLKRHGRRAPEPVIPGLPPERRVYTCRNLRLGAIAAIGFDMDHTLAVYNTQVFSRVCFDLAVEAMIERHGYPAEIRNVPYLADAVIRGLVVDKKLGNLLKVDRYSYVSRVRHGSRLLQRDERRAAYKRGRIQASNKRYRIFDTLFDLPEGSLYTSLVDLKDAEPGLIKAGYRQLFDDIRDCVDTIHRDGTLKRIIMADPGRFFRRDPALAGTLRRFREAGKKLFLLTNSESDYTGVVMDHLLGGKRGSWEEVFDLVVCFARKPGFFLQKGAGKRVPKGKDKTIPNRRGHCFTGGDAFFLENKLGAFGDAILYFGDHTYGDILRSKKSVAWRTSMIIPELEEEVTELLPLRAEAIELNEIEQELEERVLRRDQLAVAEGDDSEAVGRLDRGIGRLLGRRSALQRKLGGALNPCWGSLFREGRAPSRLGAQTQDFACIYTSRVSNLSAYPADKFFARPAVPLPHERGVVAG